MPVSGGLAFTSLSAGYAHACGTTADGSLYCWGEDTDGQFGDGGAAGVPPQLVTGGQMITALATQVYRSCALATDGSVTCWPARTTIPASTPQTQIGLGEQLGCSLDAGGMATCWTPSAGWRASTAPGALRFASIAVGGGTACGLTLSGAAWCWGANGYDTLGSPDAKGLTQSDLAVKVYGQE
jgi:alpha-tubulin suppressor-like RCC1 family protein